MADITSVTVEEKTKICVSCGEDFPADREFFYGDRRQPDGLRSTCKGCYSELPSVQKRIKERAHG
ncbi:hypothetical protein [Salinicola sp. CR57]|uniref:hypothetical protein n=1 Tax=Salinicola sp. CR57 TaxID=1949086 RepID=UPI000DA22BB9|nr:hypothetical protein [Salinicola sp. CR57]